MGKEIRLTEENFKSEVLDSNVPVLVDFWATWCAPCRMIAPAVEAVAEEYAGRAKVGKVNTEEAMSVAGEYGIVSIPTLIIFKDGKPFDQMVGAVSKDVIKAKLDAAL